MSAQSGHQFNVSYLHEDNGFLQDPADSDHKPAGGDATLDRAEGSNQAVRVLQPGSREAAEIVERLFDGAWSLSFVYTNPWWLNFAFGPPSTEDNGDGTYTHTWDGAEEPEPQRIVVGRQASGAERVLGGCVAARVRVSPSTNDLARVTISGAYADDMTADVADVAGQPGLEHSPMTFADAELSLDGERLGLVQSATLEVQSNAELVPEMGSRTPVDVTSRPVVPSIDFEAVNLGGSTDRLEEMYGAVGADSVRDDVEAGEGMALTLDNGAAAGAGANSLTCDVGGTFPDTYGEDGLGDPESRMTEAVTRQATGVSFSAVNEVAEPR